MNQKSVDVIIPVYKPTEHLLSVLLWLKKQTASVNKVIIINTEEQYWNHFFGDFDILAKYPFIELHHIKKEDFDHGGTRNLGISYSDSEYFLLMTDDAVPADERMVELLLRSFENERVGMAYARQLPHKRCHTIEKYTRTFNYPPASELKSIEDVKRLGIKTFFASDVCCMYRRSIFDRLQGFITHTIFNEDMIYARKMLESGYLVAYEAQARVFHSHNYTGIEYLRRNFDIGVSQTDHPEVFGDVKSEGEGIRLVKETASYLIHKLMPWLVIKLVYQSACKYIGFKLGRGYKKLPRRLVLKLTLSPTYFIK